MATSTNITSKSKGAFAPVTTAHMAVCAVQGPVASLTGQSGHILAPGPEWEKQATGVGNHKYGGAVWGVVGAREEVRSLP